MTVDLNGSYWDIYYWIMHTQTSPADTGIISFCFYEEKFFWKTEFTHFYIFPLIGGTQRGDKFRREKRRNGVLERTRQRKSKAVSERERERVIEFPVTRCCQPSLIGYQPQGHYEIIQIALCVSDWCRKCVLFA